MTRNAALKILNPALLILGADQAVSGILMKTNWSETLATVHGINGFALTLVAAIHLTLNWNWIKLTYFKAKKK